MIWDEFLRHFRFCDEEDSGLSDEGEKDQKIAQSTHENGYIKPRKTFWRNSKQLLKLENWRKIQLVHFLHKFAQKAKELLLDKYLIIT